jgi:hydrogenase nickel incorporation protein HypA/HybF
MSVRGNQNGDGKYLIMHEMSLAENVLQIIEDAATSEGFSRVKTVWLEIGQLSCVEKEAMRFCFDAVTRDSIAHDARLEIIEISGRGRCDNCACDVPLAALHEVCPHCGKQGLAVSAGDTMRVFELEVQ